MREANALGGGHTTCSWLAQNELADRHLPESQNKSVSQAAHDLLAISRKNFDAETGVSSVRVHASLRCQELVRRASASETLPQRAKPPHNSLLVHEVELGASRQRESLLTKSVLLRLVVIVGRF